MAIKTVTEIYQRTGERDAYTFGTSTRKFKVTVDDPTAYDDTDFVATIDPISGTQFEDGSGVSCTLPLIRDAHPTRIGIYCTALSASEVDFGCWEITATYGRIDPEIYPWNRAVIPSMNFATYEIPIDELDTTDGEGEETADTDGELDDGSDDSDDPDAAQSTLLHNTAGDAFDPSPTRVISMPVITVQKNLQYWSQVVAWANMTDSVNLYPWLGWEAGRVRAEFGGMTMQAEQILGIETYYYTVTMTFYVNTLPWGHKLRILNAGFNELVEKETDDGTIKVLSRITVGNREVSTPWPLAIDGSALPKPGEDGFPGTPVWLTYEVHEKKDFSIFGLSAPTP